MSITVGELMKALASFPPELEVVTTGDWQYELGPPDRYGVEPYVRLPITGPYHPLTEAQLAAMPEPIRRHFENR